MDMENRDQILLALGELKGQVGGFILAQSLMTTRQDAHDERVRKLEGMASRAKGTIAGVAGMVSAVVTLVTLAGTYFVKGM